MSAAWTRLRFVPIALVALVTFVLLRSQVWEWYLVPSASMEPTLHGDPRGGDLVLVDKTAYWTRDPAPWDMVVTRGGKEGQIVKRLICLAGPGGAAVAIRGGDVWVGADERSLARVVKDPRRDRDLRITHFELGPEGPASGERLDFVRGATPTPQGLSVHPAAGDAEALRGLVTAAAQDRRRTREPGDLWLQDHLATAHPVDLSFAGTRGEAWRASDHHDRDIGMEARVVPAAGCTALHFVFEHHDVYWSFLYHADGAVELLRQGLPTGASAKGPAVRPGAASAFEFGHLDGRFFLIVDDRIVLLHDQDLPEAHFEPRYTGARHENLLHLGCAGAPVTVTRVRVFRDLWYRPAPLALVPIGAPTRLEPGEMFLLGDNTFDSLDSRMRARSEGHFRRADLIGRPLAILAPRTRTRWLTR